MRNSAFAPPVTFFHTLPMPCPYMDGRTERRLVADLSSRRGRLAHDDLSRAGFRRSQNLIYRPACPSCNACIPVRVRTSDFRWSKGFRRTMNRCGDLKGTLVLPRATREQFDLFSVYQNSRHGGGEMALMDFADYSDMVEQTTIETALIEYRNSDEKLMAVMLMDSQEDGLSAVYSFFASEIEKDGAGTFMVLDLVRRARDAGMPYVYLGYWIEECRKMSYKKRYQPCEALIDGRWVEIQNEGTTS